MVTLNRELVFLARTLFDASNVHRLKGMILAYEQAVDLHNHSWPARRVYHREPENRLRAFVLRECCRKCLDAIEENITRLSQILTEQAAELRRLDDRSDAIEKVIREWYNDGLPNGRGLSQNST
jgi:hypothetical protein